MRVVIVTSERSSTRASGVLQSPPVELFASAARRAAAAAAAPSREPSSRIPAADSSASHNGTASHVLAAGDGNLNELRVCVGTAPAGHGVHSELRLMQTRLDRSCCEVV
ncbi:unnamed protein product [Lampetra planeri]